MEDDKKENTIYRLVNIFISLVIIILFTFKGNPVKKTILKYP